MATAIAAVTLIVPTVASAKTVKFSITDNGKSSGPPDYEVNSKVTGTFGTGTGHSTTSPPKSVGYWKVPGGTIYYTYTTALEGTVATGKGTITKGSGKYKGIKGSFTVRGDILGKFPFAMKGTATY